jgi:hypothetical protein
MANTDTTAVTWNHEIPMTHEVRGKTGLVRVWHATPRIRGFILSGSVGNAYKFCTSTVLREHLAEEELGIVYLKEFGISIFKHDRDSAFLFHVLDTVAEITGRDEFRHAPWILFGHSVDGLFAQNIAVWKPGRVVGILHYKSGNLGNPKNMYEPYMSLAPMKDIPFLAVSGRYEEYGPDGPLEPGQSRETQWWAIRDTLRLLRPQGYRTALAVDHYGDASHTSWSPESARLMAVFTSSIARAQIPVGYDGTSPAELVRIPETEGWLSDTGIPELIDSSRILVDPVESRYSDFPADRRSTAYWHPDSVTAREWVRFHHQGSEYPPSAVLPGARPRNGVATGGGRTKVRVRRGPRKPLVEGGGTGGSRDLRGARQD